MRRLRLLFVLAGLLLTSLTPFVSEAGFGISPPRIQEHKLVRGATVKRVIYLVQGDPLQATQIQVSVDDSRIKDWITVVQGYNFTIPKGTQQFPMEVLIKVPDDAELTVYKGFIRVTTVPTPTQTGTSSTNVTIAIGARVDIDLTVGNTVYYEYAIRNIDFSSITEIDDPQAFLTIENLGNVPAGPTRSNFELFNSFGDIRLAFVQNIPVPRVPAFETETVIVPYPLPVRLGEGTYQATARFYDDDKLVREYKDSFSVRKSTFFEKYRMIILISGGVIVLLAVLIILRRIFKRKRRSNA